MFTPSMVKIVRYLRENQVCKTREEIASIIQEKPEYVNAALDRLIALTVLFQNQGGYTYNTSPHSEQFCNSIMEIYRKVNRRPARELLVRGLICQIPSHYLIHAHTLIELLQGQGFEKKELQEFLEQEIENGYLRRIRVICLGIRPFSIPVYVPSYYLSHLRILGWEEYSSLHHDQKVTEFFEEDYLIGYYPPELSQPAREYIEKEGQELKAKLRERGMAPWL